MNGDTSKKWVLVTGASTGIGRSTAEYLASNGFSVYAGARKQQDLDDLNNIKNITAVQLDVTNTEQIKAVKEKIEKDGTGLYCIVNNAGIAIPGPLMLLSDKDLEDIYNVNLLGIHRITQAFLPFIKESQGRIIMISSMAGFFSMPFNGAYSISKYALEGYSEALRRELLLDDIPVSIIWPGTVKTDIWRKAFDNIDIVKNTEYEDLAPKVLDLLKKRVENKGHEPIVVAKGIYKAITSKKPKIRYILGGNGLMYKLMRIISPKRIDNLIKKLSKKWQSD